MEAEARAGGNPVKISNAEQNRIYEEEKRKVWDLQASALSNPIPPVLTVAEEEAARNAQPPVMPGLAPKIHRGDSRRAFSRGTSMAATPRASIVQGIEARVFSQWTAERATIQEILWLVKC